MKRSQHPGPEEDTLFSWPHEVAEPVTRDERSPGFATLIAERRRLYELLDTLPGMICVLDPGHHVVFSNKAFRSRFGESEGRRCHEFIFALDAPCGFCQTYTVLETGIARNWQVTANDGGILAVHAYPFADIDGSPLILEVAVDITEQRREESELAAHRERLEELVGQGTSDLEHAVHRFKSLFAHSPEAIFISRADGSVEDANPAAEAMFGWSADELCALGRGGILDARDPRLGRALEERARTGVVVGRELTAIRKGGERFIVEVDSVVVPGGTSEAFVMMRDVTERRRVERESLVTAQALNLAGIGVMRVDENGRVVQASEALMALLGNTHEELLAATIFDLVVDLDPGMWPQRWQQGLDAGWEQFERRLRAKSGELVAVVMSMAMSEVDGKPCAHTFVRDIRQENAARAALVERDEQLRQSQKMEAIGQLAGGIAHDFNNLLTTIIGNSSLALSRLETGDPNRELVEGIKQVADRAAGLTKQILAFSRRQILRPETISVNAIVAELEPLLAGSLGEQVELRVRLAADPAYVKIDPHQLQQTIVNLGVNARDAMPDGGRLVIETTNVTLDKAYCLTHPEVPPGDYVQLAVSDQGCGMDAATLLHIFEPFFTTKEVGKGTGLGLATVFGVIKQSGGSISVYSEPGHGTTFKIYLPTVRTGAILEATAPAEEADLRGGETILVVEDEESVRQLIARVLSRAGYTVLEAASAADAERVLEGGGRPDLVLTDMMLPGGVNGRALVEGLRERHPGLDAVFMSGYSREMVAQDQPPGDRLRFIEKPFAPAVLLEQLRAALDQQDGRRP